MQVSNLTNSPVFAIAFHKRYGVGIAVVITANTTDQTAKLPSIRKMKTVGYKSTDQSIQQIPNGPEKLIVIRDTDPYKEITVYFGPSPKKLLPQHLQDEYQVKIACSSCKVVRPIGEIIVRTKEGLDGGNISKDPLSCWYCNDKNDNE